MRRRSIPQFTEAKRLFDALDYDAALRALDLAITGLEAKAVNDPARRELLPAAYEMRARSKFGLGDQNGAKADFVALLKINAGHALTGQVSPRVVALFEEAVKTTVTSREPDGHTGHREDPDRRHAGPREQHAADYRGRAHDHRRADGLSQGAAGRSPLKPEPSPP